MWVRFPLDYVYGITDKINYTIYLNNYYENTEKYINFLCNKIINKIHENSNHVLRLILNINNIELDKFTPTHQNIFKYDSFNNLTSEFVDQGDKWEKLVFGDKIKSLFIIQCIFILNSTNFNLSINEFRNRFMNIKTNNFTSDYLNNTLNELKNIKDNKLLNHIKALS